MQLDDRKIADDVCQIIMFAYLYACQEYV